jgi:phosphatidylserine/phosphatidylglycerophosphate/cardiolipin synthase-like enzyme
MRAASNMKRPSLSTVAVAVFAVLASILLYPRLGRQWRTPLRSVSPVTTPGAARIEGPFFSDGDRIADRIVAAINHSKKSVRISMYDLTEPAITAALEAAQRRGVEVRIVADERQSHEPHSEVPYLAAHGIPVRLSRGYKGNRSIMHNKFAVFDGQLVETGSFNWTTSADQFNFENALFISDPAVAARYEDEFEHIWEQSR